MAFTVSFGQHGALLGTRSRWNIATCRPVNFAARTASGAVPSRRSEYPITYPNYIRRAVRPFRLIDKAMGQHESGTFGPHPPLGRPRPFASSTLLYCLTQRLLLE